MPFSQGDWIHIYYLFRSKPLINDSTAPLRLITFVGPGDTPSAPWKGEGIHNSDHDLTRSWPQSHERSKAIVISLLLTWHPDITIVSSVDEKKTGNGEVGIAPSLPSGIGHLETSKALPPLPLGSAAAPSALPGPGVGEGEGDGVGEGTAVRNKWPGRDGGKTAALSPKDSKTNVGTEAEGGGPAGDGVPMNSGMGEEEGASGGPVAPPVGGPTSGAVFRGREGGEGVVEGRMGGQQEEGLGGGVEGGRSGEVAGKEGKVQEILGVGGSSAER